MKAYVMVNVISFVKRPFTFSGEECSVSDSE